MVDIPNLNFQKTKKKHTYQSSPSIVIGFVGVEIPLEQLIQEQIVSTESSEAEAKRQVHSPPSQHVLRFHQNPLHYRVVFQVLQMLRRAIKNHQNLN